jgi:hypothetical protein
MTRPKDRRYQFAVAINGKSTAVVARNVNSAVHRASRILKQTPKPSRLRGVLWANVVALYAGENDE